MFLLITAMIFLIFASAIFVLAEFSFLRVRMSRIEQLIEQGNKKAVALKKNIDNLDEVLSASQIGITVTSLILGSLGEPALAHLFEPIFKDLGLSEAYLHPVSLVVALVIVTFVHVVLGEMFPKSIAIRYAENIALLLAKPMNILTIILKPIVFVMNGTSNCLIKLFGLRSDIQHKEIHSQEELEHIIEESYDHGEIDSSELTYVKNVFQSNDLMAKHIMTPRVEITAIDVSMTPEEVLEILSKEQFTRFPITTNNDKDNIIGFFNMKDFLLAHAANKIKTIEQFKREILPVHESINVIDLMKVMQKKSIHFAVVLDEFGGTSGIITMEDILEEIVGDIRDEYDLDEKASITKVNDDTYIVDGKVLISEINKMLDINISNEDVDTIGGVIFQINQNAKTGSIFELEEAKLTLLELEENRYKRVKIEKKIIEKISEEK